MNSKMVWNAFEKTGDINIFLEYRQMRDIEKNILEDKNGNSKDKSNYFKRK